MDLKYELKLKENIVSFQILKMAECMRGNFCKTASNNIVIRSDSAPELRYSLVFLPGLNKELDNNKVIYVLASNEKATKYYNKIKFALEEIFGKPNKWTMAFKYGRKSSCK